MTKQQVKAAAGQHRSHDDRSVFLAKSEDGKGDFSILNLLLFLLEDMCEPMLKSLQHMVIPKLDRTLQEVAAPTWDGFASTWQYFLETCEDMLRSLLD